MKDGTGMATMGTPTASKEVSGGGSKSLGSRVVSIKKKNLHPKTELWHSVHVVGPENGSSFAQMFARAKCSKSKRGVEDADIVVFTGGCLDIHPELYGISVQESHNSVYFESQACVDLMLEWIETYQECMYTGKAMVGVCLGAQFLHVMNGGKLYQDVDSHQSSHPLYCATTGATIMNASSVHHQMCVENDDMVVLGTACESNERWIDRTNCDLVIDDPRKDDIEAFFYPDTLCLGFQGHPEYSGYDEYTEWCMRQMLDRLINNGRMALENSVLKLKGEHLAQRKFKLPDTVQAFIKEYS